MTMEMGDSSNHNNLTPSCNCDPRSASDLDSMVDTVELRLIMAYTKRRRMKANKGSVMGDSPITLHADASSTRPSLPKLSFASKKEVKVKKGMKKRGGKDPCGFFSCAKPKVRNEGPPPPAVVCVQDRCLDSNDGMTKKDSSGSLIECGGDKLEDIAGKLAEIADEIPFTPPEIQPDSKEECCPEAVEKVIALLLREAGDKLNREELAKAGIVQELFWNYRFFETVVQTLLTRMGLRTSEPNALGPQASAQTQIAVACEVTSRLSALETLPMSRMLDHGARYLQTHYSSWAQQHGGYEQAFSEDVEDEVQ